MMRATFTSPYVVKKEDLPLNRKRHRLGDLLVYHAGADVDDFTNAPGVNEFIVFDCDQSEKGWFQVPDGYTDDQLQGVIESHFDSKSLQILPRVWVV